eukprot:2621420-Prymnesium_polylepis.1
MQLLHRGTRTHPSFVIEAVVWDACTISHTNGPVIEATTAALEEQSVEVRRKRHMWQVPPARPPREASFSCWAPG